jgi:hypothetical protein
MPILANIFAITMRTGDINKILHVFKTISPFDPLPNIDFKYFKMILEKPI